ncbi:adenosine receptor A2b-like [Ptychodera flava]|uniref:adenosine receptor A2b-like n=1 Tax=Ptychodera flava TaxID=63121 RepID=UPI00396A3B27
MTSIVMNSSNGTFWKFLPCNMVTVTHSDSLHLGVSVFYVTIIIVLILAILIGNTLVVLAVHRTAQLQLTSNWMLVRLSCSDLTVALVILISVIFQPHVITSFHLDPFHMCLIRLTFMAIPACVSAFHLTMIAFDRYIAISRPLRYHQIMTPRRGQAMIAFCWIYGSFLMLLPIFGWRKDRPTDTTSFICLYAKVYEPSYVWFILFVGFIPVCSLLAVFYLLLFMQAYKTTRQILSQQHNLNTSTNVPAKTELKAVKTVLVIVGVFAVCWIPTVCLIGIESQTKEFSYDCSAYYLERFLFLMALSNSAMNPVIYGYRNADFRKAFHKIIGSLCRKICSLQMCAIIPVLHND